HEARHHPGPRARARRPAARLSLPGPLPPPHRRLPRAAAGVSGAAGARGTLLQHGAAGMSAHGRSAEGGPVSSPLLEVHDLVKHYRLPREKLLAPPPVVHALQGVSFTL